MEKLRRWLLLLMFPFVLAACQSTATVEVEEESLTYTNPLGEITNIGDPYVLKDGDTYYMYATSEPSIGYKVWTSTDFESWEDQGLAYDHREQEDKWAFRDFWAPEVIEYNEEFIMIYSARAFDGSLSISLAKSDSPLGPFVDYAIDIIPYEGSYIDGHIFVDEDDGEAYLYYVKDNYENIIDGDHISHIYVQEMNADLSAVEGEPVFLLGPDQPWEGVGEDYQWNEGPFVLERDDTYYLMYSANFYASPEYAVGYATSDNPMGPFTKSEHNPILSSDLENGVSGPGHNSVTVGPDGETLLAVYHIHTSPEYPSGDRRPAMDEIYFDEEGNLWIEGPTMDEQVLETK